MVHRHRKNLGGSGRALPPGRQALPVPVLAYPRKGETYAQLAQGFEVSIATAWRHVNKTVPLPAARSPNLEQAPRKAVADGLLYLVLDATLTPIDPVKADRLSYPGKHHRHGMNLQVISSPDGSIVRVSNSLPDATHDLTAARI